MNTFDIEVKCKLKKCDTFGDKREGWDNCSSCGKTDWEGLYKKKLTTEEVMNLITQSEEIMNELADIEHDYFTKDFALKKIHPSTMGQDEIGYQSAQDEPFENYLSDRNLLVTNHVNCLSKRNRTILFAESHDRIFETKWIKTMRSLRREKGFEI